MDDGETLKAADRSIRDGRSEEEWQFSEAHPLFEQMVEFGLTFANALGRWTGSRSDVTRAELDQQDALGVARAAFEAFNRRPSAPQPAGDGVRERERIVAHMIWWEEQGGDAEPGWLAALISQIEGCEYRGASMEANGG